MKNVEFKMQHLKWKIQCNAEYAEPLAFKTNCVKKKTREEDEKFQLLLINVALNILQSHWPKELSTRLTQNRCADSRGLSCAPQLTVLIDNVKGKFTK